MKKLIPTATALALLLGLGLAQTPAGGGHGRTGETPPDETPPEEAEDEAEAAPQGDLAQRVQALEAEVAALRADLASANALLRETTSYLAGAKERGRALQSTFDAAEEAGFTAGINFHSREILLAGLRAYVSAETEDLPGAKPEGAKE